MCGKILSFVGIVALAFALSACGDSELKAAQDFKLPGESRTAKVLLDRNYDKGEWIVDSVPDFMKKKTSSKKIVTYFGFSHGVRNSLDEFLNVSESVCQGNQAQIQSLQKLLDEKKAMGPAGAYDKLQHQLDKMAYAEIYCSKMFVASVLDGIGLKNPKEVYAAISFEFDEKGNPILKEGREALEYAARCYDPPDACDKIEIKRTDDIARAYNRFKDRLAGQSLQEFLAQRNAKKWDGFRERILKVGNQ